MRASIRVYSTCSVLDFRRQLAAIGRELRHHLLVQPDIHARGIIGVAGIAELLGKFLARGEDWNRCRAPSSGRRSRCATPAFPSWLRRPCPGSERRRPSARAPPQARQLRRLQRELFPRLLRRVGAAVAPAAEDRAHDFSENAHRSLPVDLKMDGVKACCGDIFSAGST